MAPAQPVMEIDQDCKPYMNVKVELDTENRSSLENSVGERLRCTNDCEDTAVMMGPSLLNRKDKAPMCIVDAELDIMECTNDHHRSLQAETEDPDATEYSSSFADTTSDTENFSGFSEGEVQSQFFADNGLTSAFDAFNSAFQMRKKKLTNHWRAFIRPVMWRCKWMELRIKEIESQSLKYSRELAVVYNQRKHSGLDQFALEEFGSKSLPFSSQCRRKKVMKRRKRKRVEETTDIASYMSNHNVFSYLENKGSDPDSTSVADEFSNAVTDHTADYNDKLSTDDDGLFFEFRDGDKYLEQVLSKIETLDSRVHNLKNQINLVMSSNAARFSSSENLSLLVPCEAQTSSAHSLPLSAGNGEAISAGVVYTSAQYMSEYNIEDLVMPESAVSSIGEAITVPDIIESTVGLLSGIDVTFHQAQFGDSNENIVDNVLIHNEAAEGEKQAFQMISDQPKEKHPQAEERRREECSFPTPQLEPDPLAEAAVPQEQSTLESCLVSDVNFPRNKRKRGERKAGSVVWRKKCSGKPDSP